jgi:hypothetical protein
MQPLAAILLLAQIAKGKRHADYDYVLKLTTLYRQLFLGENIKQLIVQTSPREDEKTLEVRTKYVIQHCPAWAASIMNDFNEVYRIRPVAKGFKYSKENSKSELQKAVNGFFGKNNVDFWQKNVLHELPFYDPNAFVIIDNAPDFDNKREKAAPYPFIVESPYALDYKYENDLLQYLGVEVEAKYKIGSEVKTGKKYTLYVQGYALTLTPVDPKLWKGSEQKAFNFDAENLIITNKTKFEDYYYWAGENSLYQIDVYYNGIDTINAFRVGSKRDPITQGRTCISLLHPATSYMLKSVNAISELDLTYLNHVYPQKAQYVQKCKIDFTGICETSKEQIASCSRCGGNGMPVHKTASDILLLPLPEDFEKNELLDLGQLIKYFAPDPTIIDKMEERLKMLEEKSYEMVFNTDQAVKSNISDTATQKMLEKQSKYNAYLPFAEKVADIYRTVVYLVAAWRDEHVDLVVEYILPGDFKLESLNELITTLKTANESGLPSPLRETIINDIAAKMYIDQPMEFKKFLTKQYYNPFRSKSEKEIAALLANALVSTDDKILYANFDKVFTKLEAENTDFYEIADPKLQYDKLEAVVKIIADTIKAENATVTSFE